jgi:hypothetical protein
MVVNAVFKNQGWLYVQTPHGEEGYVRYCSILPLGILPPRQDEAAPPWESQEDVFPKPVGRRARSDCGLRPNHPCHESNVDRLYLQVNLSL